MKSRFDSNTLDYLTAIEDLLVEAANGKNPEIGDLLQKNLAGDVNLEQLRHELALLPTYLKECNPRLTTVTSVNTVMDCLQYRNTYSIVITIRQTQIVIKLYRFPMPLLTAERSLSGLRRVKSYLRSSMTQEHLNHLLMLQKFCLRIV